jgi:DNA polymerase (family X)
MPDLSNRQIADRLEELGDLYELDGAIVHRVVAYREAARAVRDASVSVAALVRAGRATELPGIGRTLAEKLAALVETGDIPAAVRLRERYPAGLIAMTRLPGFGPKRARRLHEELGVDSLEALRVACEQQRVRGVRGFGAKVEEQLLEVLAVAGAGRPQPRVVLSRALDVAGRVLEELRAHPAADRVEVAGSVRRLADSVKDIDIVATATEPAALARALVELDLVEPGGTAGEAGARVRTHSGIAIDLKVVEPDQFGNVLQHLTGSRAHNMALREAAARRGLHVSEYGILDDATGMTHRCASEEEVYALLGLAYIEPELREGRGELEAAAAGGGGVPELVRETDLRGDLHCHTTASDGRDGVRAMAEAARARGYEYLAITDHSATHGFGNEVSPDELRRHIERIRAVSDELPGFELLAGSEVNILPDGSPDYDDELLAELDWVIASVHTAFRMGEREMTDRIVAAVEHPLVDALGHPTGRKIERREPYAVDMEGVIEAAGRTGTMVEINASPDRRDLDDVHARAAAAAGVPILIDSDAHSRANLALVRFGVATARRAWLSPDQVANTRPWAALAALRKGARTARRAG